LGIDEIRRSGGIPSRWRNWCPGVGRLRWRSGLSWPIPTSRGWSASDRNGREAAVSSQAFP